MSTVKPEDLPESVRYISLDGRDIYLVGTAHISKQSVEDVRTTIELVKPETICVELCEPRYNAMKNQDEWKKMDIFKVIKEGKATFLLAQLIMSSFYKRIGDQLGVKPGAEMAEGIRLAEETGANLVLADRDVQITLKRTWGHLNFWNKIKMMTQIMASLFVSEEIDEEMIDEMKKQDQIGDVLETFAKAFPSVKATLIDERDIYLAQKIKDCQGQTVVAAVGAGHVPGMVEQIKENHTLEEIEKIPEPSLWPKLLKWGIPLVIVAIVVYGFFHSGAQHSLENIGIWILVNGILSALGAAIALGHPITVISAFLAAPITSLNPMVAAGWVSGLVQAWVKKPRVEDFEELPKAIASIKGFWTNPVSRVLLVVALSNVGSSLGTFISGGWIAARSLS